MPLTQLYTTVDFFLNIGYNKSILRRGGELPVRKEKRIKKDKTIIHDELRPEYDLKNLRVRKFGPARKQFGNFVQLEPDVAAVFSDASTANEALRHLIQATRENRRTYSYNLPTKPLDRGSKQLDNSIIKLEPDVIEAYPDAASVNKALRFLIRVTKESITIPPTKS